MKETPRRRGNVPRHLLQEANRKQKPPIKANNVRFDTSVARHYSTVYSFASRPTSDPRKAVLLTHDALRKRCRQLRIERPKQAARRTTMPQRIVRSYFHIAGVAPLFITLFLAPVFAQSPLEAPGEQKVQITVRSEIARGCEEVSQAAASCELKALLECMHNVIYQNISMHKDSDGFMLGARLQQLKQLDHALESLRSLANPTQDDKEEMSTFLRSAKMYANDVRALQKKLGINDDALAEAQTIFNRTAARPKISQLLTSYQSQFVTIVQSVSVDHVVLAAGTRLEFISKEGAQVHVRCGVREYTVPIFVTDLNP
jgi:hypothetical protein